MSEVVQLAAKVSDLEYVTKRLADKVAILEREAKEQKVIIDALIGDLKQPRGR